MTITIDEGCSIYPRGKNNDLWYIRFKEKGRSPYRKSLPLNTKDQTVATGKAYQLCNDWKRGNYDPWNDVDVKVTVQDAVRFFVRERKDEIKTYKDNVWILEEVCKAGKITFIRALSATDIRKVIWQRELAPATRHSYFNKLSAILTWLTAKKYLSSNPLDDVAKPAEPDIKPKYYDTGEVQALLTAGRIYLDMNAKHTHNKYPYPDWFIDAFELVSCTGMRKMDTPNLCWGDIKFPGEAQPVGSITIRMSKRDRDRVVTMLPQTQRLLRRLEAKTRISNDPYEPVLKRADGVTAISGDKLSRKFTAVQQFAKLKPIGLHGLRHSFAVMLVFAGVHIRAIQIQMAHKDLSTTMKYTQLSNDDVLKLTYERFLERS